MTETQNLLDREPNGESQTQPILLSELSGINFNTLKKSVTFRDILKLADAFLDNDKKINEFMKVICPDLRKEEFMPFKAKLKLKDNFLLQFMGNGIMNERDLADLIHILEKDLSVSTVVDELKQFKNQSKIYEDLTQKPMAIIEFVNDTYVVTNFPNHISPVVPWRRIDTKIKFLFHPTQISQTHQTIFNDLKRYLKETIPKIEFVDLSNNNTNLEDFFIQTPLTPLFVLYDKQLYSQMRKYRGYTIELEDRVSIFINLFLKIYMEFLTDKTNKRFYLFSFDDFDQNEEFVYKWLLRVPNERPFLIKGNAEDPLLVRIKQFLSSNFYNLGGV